MKIDNLAEFVVFGAKTHMAVKLAFEDRKIDGSDIIHFLPALQALSPAVQGLELVIPEFEDLDSGEVEQLIEIVKKEDPALGSQVVAIERVKACLKLAVAILEVYKTFKAQKTVDITAPAKPEGTVAATKVKPGKVKEIKTENA